MTQRLKMLLALVQLGCVVVQAYVVTFLSCNWITGPTLAFTVAAFLFIATRPVPVAKLPTARTVR